MRQENRRDGRKRGKKGRNEIKVKGSEKKKKIRGIKEQEMKGRMERLDRKTDEMVEK